MSDVDTTLLINEIRHYPELYLMEHLDFKNSYKKEVAWQNIHEKTGLEVKALKAKWKNLRDTYKKYKQSRQKICGQVAHKYAKWMWAEKMSFLDSATHLRSTESTSDTSTQENIAAENHDSKHIQLNQMEENHDPKHIQLNQMEDTLEPIEINVTETKEEPKTSGSNILQNQEETRNSLKQRKRRRVTDPADRILSYLHTRKSSSRSTTQNTEGNLVKVPCDRLDMTFLGYADSVKKLSPNNQTLIKLQFTKLITEYELKEQTN